MDEPGDITLLLERAHLDEPGALEALCRRCLPEIRGIAHNTLRGTTPTPDLHTTMVVNEVYLKLHGGSTPRRYQHRSHYFGSAMRAARQVVTDFGRRNLTRRRVLQALSDIGLSAKPTADVATPEQRRQRDEYASAVARALESLLRDRPREAQVVILRLIHGLTEQEIARRLGVSRRTAQNDWQFARAYLRDALERDDRLRGS
jgi:RNA polymerase sigma factor (TIGR02999 family)